jgi:hypothetical protein
VFLNNVAMGLSDALEFMAYSSTFRNNVLLAV